MIGAVRFYVSSIQTPEKPQREAPDHEPHLATAPFIKYTQLLLFSRNTYLERKTEARKSAILSLFCNLF